MIQFKIITILGLFMLMFSFGLNAQTDFNSDDESIETESESTEVPKNIVVEESSEEESSDSEESTSDF